MEDAISNEQLLQAQVDELSSKLDEEMRNVKFREDSAEMYLVMARDTIIAQRINSAEGTSAEDFQDVFPFLPKTSEEKQNQLIELKTSHLWVNKKWHLDYNIFKNMNLHLRVN